VVLCNKLPKLYCASEALSLHGNKKKVPLNYLKVESDLKFIVDEYKKIITLFDVDLMQLISSKNFKSFWLNLGNKYFIKLNGKRQKLISKQHQFLSNLGALQKNNDSMQLNEQVVQYNQSRWLEGKSKENILVPLNPKQQHWFFFWDIESYMYRQNPWLITFFIENSIDFEANVTSKLKEDVYFLTKFDDYFLKGVEEANFTQFDYFLTSRDIEHVNKMNSRCIGFLSTCLSDSFHENSLLKIYIHALVKWFLWVSSQLDVEIIGYAYNSGKYDTLLTAEFFFTSPEYLVTRYVQKNRRIYDLQLENPSGSSSFKFRDLILLLPPLGESNSLKNVAKILKLKFQKIETFNFKLQDAMLEAYALFLTQKDYSSDNKCFLEYFYSFVNEALEYNIFDCIVLQQVAHWISDICKDHFLGKTHVLFKNIVPGFCKFWMKGGFTAGG
jgi:hypothetical protein